MSFCAEGGGAPRLEIACVKWIDFIRLFYPSLGQPQRTGLSHKPSPHNASSSAEHDDLVSRRGISLPPAKTRLSVKQDSTAG